MQRNVTLIFLPQPPAADHEEPSLSCEVPPMLSSKDLVTCSFLLDCLQYSHYCRCSSYSQSLAHLLVGSTSLLKLINHLLLPLSLTVLPTLTRPMTFPCLNIRENPVRTVATSDNSYQYYLQYCISTLLLQACTTNYHCS